MSDKVLLVIDMVNDFVREDGALSCGSAARDIIDNVAARASAARSRGERVIFICDRHRSDDPEFDMFPPHCISGTSGAEIIPELKPQSEDIIIYKRRFSGFMGTDLDLQLRDIDAKALEITGVCTNICVLYTAAEARMRGYEVVIPKNAVASFDQQAHEFALRELQKTLGAEIV